MNKKSLLFILIILFAHIFMYSNEVVYVQPLSKESILCAELKLDTLYITLESDKSYYYKHDNVICFQLSENKKEIIFQVYDDRFNSKYPLYHLNGNDGTISNLGFINTNWLASSNFDYIMTDTIIPEDRMLEIEIKSLPSMEVVFRIPWKSQQHNFLENFAVDGKGFYYLFSLTKKDNYDFQVTAKGYKKDYGSGYVNIKERTFI